jgi:hypothetical protein
VARVEATAEAAVEGSQRHRRVPPRRSRSREGASSAASSLVVGAEATRGERARCAASSTRTRAAAHGQLLKATNLVVVELNPQVHQRPFDCVKSSRSSAFHSLVCRDARRHARSAVERQQRGRRVPARRLRSSLDCCVAALPVWADPSSGCSSVTQSFVPKLKNFQALPAGGRNFAVVTATTSRCWVAGGCAATAAPASKSTGFACSTPSTHTFKVWGAAPVATRARSLWQRGVVREHLDDDRGQEASSRVSFARLTSSSARQSLVATRYSMTVDACATLTP